jgi:hypothetical protein
VLLLKFRKPAVYRDPFSGVLLRLWAVSRGKSKEKTIEPGSIEKESHVKDSRKIVVILGAMMLLSFSLLAHADVTYVNYNLSVPTGDLGSSQHTYGGNPYALPISGFATNVAPNINFNNNTGTWNVTSSVASNLYGKVTNNDPGETGLGMTADPDGDNEMWHQPGNSQYDWGFVKVDVSNILANQNLLYFHMAIGSAQAHEWYTIWGSTAADPNNATLLKIGAGGNNAQSPWFDVPNFRDYQYIWVGAVIDPNSNVDHSDITLESEIAFSQDPIPEPGTLALLGSGVIGMAGLLRRKLGA